MRTLARILQLDMNSELIYTSLLQSKKDKTKKLAVLIDPDRMRLDRLERVVENAVVANADYFFLGGSLIIDNRMDFCIDAIRTSTKKPIILFFCCFVGFNSLDREAKKLNCFVNKTPFIYQM